MGSSAKRIVVVSLGCVVHALLLVTPLAVAGRSARLWQDPLLILFLLVATACFLADAQTLWSGEGDTPPSSPADRRHARWALASGLALLAVFWLASLERAISNNTGLDVLSQMWAIVVAAGVMLRAVAVRTLGRHFVTAIATGNGRSLVRRGVYAWLRHPSETGLLLMAFGMSGLLQSVAGFLAALVMLGLILMRIRLEDEQLELAFGAAFRRYRRRVPGLIPLIPVLAPRPRRCNSP